MLNKSDSGRPFFADQRQKTVHHRYLTLALKVIALTIQSTKRNFRFYRTTHKKSTGLRICSRSIRKRIMLLSVVISYGGRTVSSSSMQAAQLRRRPDDDISMAPSSIVISIISSVYSFIGLSLCAYTPFQAERLGGRQTTLISVQS